MIALKFAKKFKLVETGEMKLLKLLHIQLPYVVIVPIIFTATVHTKKKANANTELSLHMYASGM